MRRLSSSCALLIPLFLLWCHIPLDLPAQPKACFTASANPGACEQAIVFEADCSYHANWPMGTLVRYDWSLDGGETWLGEGAPWTHTFTTFGLYTITLRVRDNLGYEDFTHLTMLVDRGNRAPVARAGGPYTIGPGEVLVLDATASTDPDEACGDAICYYHWDLDNDGDFADLQSTEPRAAVHWAQLEALGLTSTPQPIHLRVADMFGYTHESTTTLAELEPRSPVELMAFTGEYQPTGVQLKWRTRAAGNYAHFAVQRSVHGFNWHTLPPATDFIQRAGVATYFCQDPYPVERDTPAYFYRLTLVDLAGTTHYLQTIRVVCVEEVL